MPLIFDQWSICSFHINHQNKINLIAGIFDTDGCVNIVKKEGKFYPRLTIANKSLILTDIKTFLLENGINSSLSKNRDTGVNVLFINGNKNTNLFFNAIPIKNKKHKDRYKKWKDFQRACGSAWIERLNVSGEASDQPFFSYIKYVE